jgi:hypothetical protein
MAAGDVRQGMFSRTHADGAATIASLVGGTTYFSVAIKAYGSILVGSSTIDQGGVATVQGHRLAPGESLVLQNSGATAGLIDGAKLNVRSAEGSKPISFSIMAIDNA